MSVQEQFYQRSCAFTKNYDEVLPYLGNPNYEVGNTYHDNGLFDTYYINAI
jgi:hypothetical protein